MNYTMRSNDLEQEINATRIKLYEQTKTMTTQERVAFLNKTAIDGMVRHGIKTKMTEMPIIRQQTQP